MPIERITDFSINNSAKVNIIKQGNITEIRHLTFKNDEAQIRKIDNDTYEVLKTGEIRTFNHWENRGDGQNSLRKTFDNLRKIINTNCSSTYRCRWATLTYQQDNGEPMTDPEQLYDDFRKFILRFNYFCKKHGYGKPEYIVAREPQHNGAWHAHVLFIFSDRAPYIHNDTEFNPIWGHGYTSFKTLKSEFGDVDNVGAYLTAYLADIDLESALNIKNLNLSDYICKNGRWFDEKENKYVTKQFIKGARLRLYPSNFRLYNTSKGIKQPIEYETDYKSAKKEVSGQTLTRTSDILVDTGDYRTVISKRYYNSKRKSNQDVINHNLVDLDTGEILEENYL